jgi:peptide/nickel transport system permease protein
MCSFTPKHFGLLGGILLLILLVLSVGAEHWVPYDPKVLSGQPFEPPSRNHWLGTNDLGQDLFSEIVMGTRLSLGVGLSAASLASSIGLAAGLLAGYFRGWVDALLMRLVDIVLVIPFLPLMILLAAYLGQDVWKLVLVIGLLSWARPARVIRAQVLSLRQRGYVEAARVIGAGNGHILRHHILPGILPLALAQFVMVASQSILLEVTLSFLGLGDPTQNSWGSVLYYAQSRNAFLTGAWIWWVLPPGLMISCTVLAFALLGFALEEIGNPRLRA